MASAAATTRLALAASAPPMVWAFWVLEGEILLWWGVMARAWVGRCTLCLPLDVSYAGLLRP